MLFHSITNVVILVSAANVTQSLTDSALSLKDFVNIFISIYSALIGAAVASILLFSHERAKDKREIKKIKSLLNSDFASLYNDMTKDRLFIQSEHDKLGEEDGLVSNIISEKMSIPDFYQKYGTYYTVEFWDAIVSSGSLLKLDKDEISRVQAVHNSLKWYNENLRELQDGTADYLYDSINVEEDSDDEPDPEEVKEALIDYFNAILSLIKDCVDDLEKLQKFSWIHLENVDD